MPAELAGEADLRILARRFADAERRVRVLLRRAPSGDRRALLREAIALLVALRRQDLRSPVVTAYLAAFRELRRGGGDPGAVRDLAWALAVKLDGGAREAARRADRAFRTARADNVEEQAHEAVTAHVDQAGKRWTLGGYAGMLTATIGRQASSRGTVHGAGEGRVVIDGSSSDSICSPLIGLTFPATVAPQPPFHVGCQCSLSAG